MTEKYLTMNELYKSEKIYWIKSFSTLRKWILRDLATRNILGIKVISSNSGKTGTRYFIPEDNIDKFIKAFNGNDNGKNLFAK